MGVKCRKEPGSKSLLQDEEAKEQDEEEQHAKDLQNEVPVHRAGGPGNPSIGQRCSLHEKILPQKV